jgi:hypothetical protein
MKRISYSIIACAMALVVASVAFATPAPNSAFLALRTFNDCPLSTLTPVNAYPVTISIDDLMNPACVGFANLHSWSFSEDGGATASLFRNGSNFEFCATVNISGAGEGEGGLRLSPWFGKFVDGRFMANVTTGEIACFGGRLPFYSFTGAYAITYVRGTNIYMRATYAANGLNIGSPATIQYRVIYNAITYDSPVIPFDQGTAAEDPPYGLWGMLNDGCVGGYFQPRANTGADLKATWSDICFSNLDVVPTESSTWGRIKTLYR